MIGLFGIFHGDPNAPVDLTGMASAVPSDRYDVVGGSTTGIGVGVARHKSGLGFSCSSSPDDQIKVRVIGELFEASSLVGGMDHAGGDDAASVILTLYRNNQLDRLAQSNGLFAAAIVDKAAHRLVLITDRFCGFAIHYHDRVGRFAFAGQMLSLLAVPGVPRKADPDALAQLFTMQRTVGRDTNIAGIRAMPAATILTVDRGGRREQSYWSLSWKPAFKDEDECAEALVSAMRGALQRQVGHGATRPGLLLSGGIDSRMVLGAAEAGSLRNWTTASYAENPELDLARETASICESPFHPAIVEPSDTLAYFDETTVANNGMYPASVQFAAFMPDAAETCDAMLTGHGLDYTLRGYYMPAKTLRVSGSTTRLPALRPIPGNPTGGDVLSNLRQGPPPSTIERIVKPERWDQWWRGQADRLDQVLEPWLRSDRPVNAWDAFILHSLSKHYAFTGMMAVRADAQLRIPAYDKAVFDVYLGMPPEWRVRGRVVMRALELLAPRLAALPNANTGFRATLGPWLEIAGLLARGVGRRLGLLARPKTPSAAHSTGSWQDTGALYRDDPAHRARLTEIRDRADGLSLGLLEVDGLTACIDEHLAGTRNHGKFLRMLLTHDAWVRRFGIEAIG